MIRLPAMSDSQEQSWLGLLAVAEVVPRGWCVVGGQMVFLLCAELGGAPARPTDDVDAVLDARAYPSILADFTRALTSAGFAPDGETWEGHQHRWMREGASIDVLIPRGVGERTRSRKGAAGGTTLETAGAQGALDHAEPVLVAVGRRTGTVLRPKLQAAIAMKAAAYLNPQDRDRRRHLIDIGVLSTLLRPGDGFEDVAPRDVDRARRGLAALEAHVDVPTSIAGGAQGVQRLRLALDF